MTIAVSLHLEPNELELITAALDRPKAPDQDVATYIKQNILAVARESLRIKRPFDLQEVHDFLNGVGSADVCAARDALDRIVNAVPALRGGP